MFNAIFFGAAMQLPSLLQIEAARRDGALAKRIGPINDDTHEHLAGLISPTSHPTPTSRGLVEQFAAASFRAWRRPRATGQAFWEYVGGHYHRGPGGIAEALVQEKEARFRPHLRQMAQAERQYYRALTAVERMGRHRRRGRDLPA